MKLYWILLAAFAVFALQAALYRRRGLKGLGYERTFSAASCVEGDQVEMIERVSNRKWLPLPWLKLESSIPVALKFRSQTNLDISEGSLFQHHASLFSLMPYTEIVRRHTVTCQRRGCYRLASATMSCGDLLGLVRVTRTLELDAELVVYPGVVPLDDIGLPSHSLQGDVTVRRWIAEDPFLISGVREYRSGDPLRSVNWKASARTGKLHVHVRDHSADHRLMILVNVEISETMWKAVTDPERIEDALRRAATLARRAIGEGMPAGFGCNGFVAGDSRKAPVRVAPAGGRAQLVRVLDAMARVEISLGVPFDLLLEREAELAEEATDYVLFTTFVSEAIRVRIDRLRQLGHAVRVVMLNDADERGREVDGDAGARAAEHR
jgi:Uncharacterized conserved protein (some members contain a von Willebrand factor type A (vWA) domain)